MKKQTNKQTALYKLHFKTEKMTLKKCFLYKTNINQYIQIFIHNSLAFLNSPYLG